MNERYLTKEMVDMNPSLIPPHPPIRVGLCFKEQLNEETLKMQQEETEKQLLNFATNLDPGSKEDLYQGTAFIIFEKSADMYAILSAFEIAPIKRFWIWFKKLFSCCFKQE